MIGAIRTGWRRWWLPWVPLLLGPLLLIGPALARGEALFWGTPILQFTPWRTYARQLLAAGQLPLWNPALGMGAPLLANYQTALLYPPNWILVLLNVAWGQTLLVMLHLMLAAIGMALLARQLGLNRFAQAISGLAFGLSGYLVARAGFLSINAASAWLPWIVLGIERLVNGAASRDRSASSRSPAAAWLSAANLRPIAWLAIAFAMQWLAGHAQLAWYSLIFAGGWLLYRTIALGGRAALPKRLAQFGVAGALALLVAGAQLAPTLEYLGESARSSGLDPEFAMTYSFWPWRLTGLIAPDLFGHPRAGSYWGYGNYWEDALYLGVLPALLAVGALLRRDGAPLRWYLAGTAGLALLLALGKNTPLFPFLYERVPTFGLFQAPTRWNLLLVFAMALLAGFGAERWGEAVGRKLYWLRLGTAGAGAVVVTAAIGAQVVGEVEPTFIPAVALAGALLLSCGVLGLTRGGRPTLIWQAFAVGLVLADLLYAARGNNPTLPLVAFEPRPAGEIAAYRAQRLYMPRAVEQDLKFEQAFRFDDFQADQDWSFVRAKVLPNTGLLDGLSSANNFDPILSARYAEWIERLESAPPALQSELYRMMGVGWVADSGGEYQPVADGRRAWVVPTAEWVSGRLAALAAVFDESFEPSERVVLERPPGMPPDGAQGSVGQPQGAAGQDSADQAQIVGQSAGRTAIQVETVQGGWLMLADSWYPGWQAYLDGTPVDSYPANGIFRAVWAPEGAHTVAFRYQPSSFRLGLSMTVLGLIGLAIALRRR